MIDRDGTLIEDRVYLADPSDITFRAGAVEGLRRLRAEGFGLVLITNQSGIARGFFDIVTLDAVHRRLNELLQAENARLDAIYHCPHGPDDGCDCRKPKPGLIHRAASHFQFSPADAFFIGDSDVDMNAARASGATGIQVCADDISRSDAADFIAADFSDAADLVIAIQHSRQSRR